MYLITGFGVLMVLLSAIMIANPRYWSEGIISFSQKSYFHWFEVVSRALFGAVFIVFNKQTLYPMLILGLGCLLVAVSLGLLLIGANRHRKFAVWSAQKFRKTFRASGCVSLGFGFFLIYISSIGVGV